MNSHKKVLVLFSGGRDSSSATIEMVLAGYNVSLFTYQAGLSELTGPNGDSAPDIRHKELASVFPDKIDQKRIIEGNTYLIRKLAIEKTNTTHVVYPIALALAVHSSAILYCIKNGIRDIACGYSGYQATEDRYIEQRSDFVELAKVFLKEYGITYHTPVIQKTKAEIMDTLEKHGVSSNSLENKSIFGGIPFEINNSLEFWNSSIPLCREYIAFMSSSFTK